MRSYSCPTQIWEKEGSHIPELSSYLTPRAVNKLHPLPCIPRMNGDSVEGRGDDALVKGGAEAG